MARVPHPCVLNESCAVNTLQETTPGQPGYDEGLILTSKISADPCNILECKPDGLYVSGPLIPATSDTWGTNPGFYWGPPYQPVPQANPIVITSASGAYTVPAGCGVGVGRVHARLNTALTTFSTSVLPSTTVDAFFSLEIVSWTIGGTSGGPVTAWTQHHTANSNFLTIAWPDWFMSAVVTPGDMVSITARLIFWQTTTAGSLIANPALQPNAIPGSISLIVTTEVL